MIACNLLKSGVGVPMIRIIIRSLVVGCLFLGYPCLWKLPHTPCSSLNNSFHFIFHVLLHSLLLGYSIPSFMCGKYHLWKVMEGRRLQGEYEARCELKGCGSVSASSGLLLRNLNEVTFMMKPCFFLYNRLWGVKFLNSNPVILPS